jgi:hypothetical protein
MAPSGRSDAFGQENGFPSIGPPTAGRAGPFSEIHFVQWAGTGSCRGAPAGLPRASRSEAQAPVRPRCVAAVEVRA